MNISHFLPPIYQELIYPLRAATDASEKANMLYTLFYTVVFRGLLWNSFHTFACPEHKCWMMNSHLNIIVSSCNNFLTQWRKLSVVSIGVLQNQSERIALVQLMQPSWFWTSVRHIFERLHENFNFHFFKRWAVRKNLQSYLKPQKTNPFLKDFV